MKIINKKAIITGANKNIGAAIACKLASEGADICLHYHTDKEGILNIKREIESIGRKVFIIGGNFSKINHVNELFEQSRDLLNGIDIVVNNAGAYNTQPFLELSVSQAKELLEIGVIAPMQLTKLAAKQMIKNSNGGSIINISSISGIRPYVNRTAHATAKSALNMLTKNTALELAQHKIRVNAICPGEVPYDVPSKEPSDIPLNRFGKPQDIANAALFLASEESSWITGHIMVVDGGQSLSF